MSRKNYEDHFEDLYLRHDYLKLATNLDGKYYKEFKHIIDITSRIMYSKFIKEFSKVGFTEEDIQSIASVYVIVYMDLYSLRNKQYEMDKFIESYRKKRPNSFPTEDEILKAEKNHMINFLRQKLGYCATLCNRKGRNIIGGRDRVVYYAFTENSKDVKPIDIIGNHTKLGYRKITIQEYKDSMKRARELGEVQPVDDQGFKIIKVEWISSGISKNEYAELTARNQSHELKSPEEIISDMEEQRLLGEYKERFSILRDKEKEKLLLGFIEKHKNNKSYKKQVALARKKVKDKDFMV